MKMIPGRIYLRYEFSDEMGHPEGGDIFQFSSPRELQKLMAQILKVAHADGVAVNFTIGEEMPFFGYMKNGGLSREDLSHEMVSNVARLTKKQPTSKKQLTKVKKTKPAKK